MYRKKMAFRILRLLRSPKRQGSLYTERRSNPLFRKAKLEYIISLLLVLFALLAGSVQAQHVSLPREIEPAPYRFATGSQGRGGAPPAVASAPLLPSGQDWTIEYVDAPRQFSKMGQRSLALDAEGHPHVAYGGDHLYYAWHDGAGWHLETVDASPGLGTNTSLALDPAGVPHISYYDGVNGDLKYAHHDGVRWQVETIDSDGYVGFYTSLALDRVGQPHISYYADNPYNALKYAHYNGTEWQIETVDSAGVVGMHTSLALDSDDHPHIIYLDWTNGVLKYAYLIGTVWISETVGGPGEAGYYTSLVLDASDRPHISYCLFDTVNYTCDDLRYSHYDGTSWQIETVDSAGYVGDYTSLALDATGQPHISYYAGPVYNDLKYAYYDGQEWQVTTVDGAMNVGEYTSLALDDAGQPHIGYYDRSELKYARYDGVKWQIETMDSAGYVGPYASLDLDASDQPHISYFDLYDTGLKYAYLSGTTWISETVDSAGTVGRHTSLALDPFGRPHISYCRFSSYNHTCNGLQYAHYDGSSWQIETVDSAGSVGYYTSLALDAAGRPHISYCLFDPIRYACDDLKYAYYDGSGLGQDQGWQIVTVDSAGHVGGYTSLALDSTGRPHISYHDDTNADLKYAYLSGTTWISETVDRTGEYTSLALDAAGRPHISYYDWDKAALKYAYHDGTSWQVTVVDDPWEGVGRYTSLALDATGHPHISYYDDLNADLKYAQYDGTSWIKETVDRAGIVGQYTSLALDSAGCPHVGYFDDSNADLKYAHRVCVELAEVEVSGSISLLEGRTGTHAASGQSFAGPAFESVWQRTDKPITEGHTARSWTWGPQPFTEALYEPYVESPGGSRLVQYFDKSRMEINDPNGDRSFPWFVSNGLLVREMVDGRVQIGNTAFEERSPAQEAVAGDPVAHNPNCPTYASFANLTWQRANHQMGQKVAATLAKDGTVGEDATKAAYPGTEIAYYEEATGHNVPQVLWDFMNQRGLIYEDERYRSGLVVDWLYAMGYPISEPYWTRCTVAGEEKDVLVQLFERRVLTYTPSNPAGWQVEMGNVGLHYYNWRYASGVTP